MGVIYIGDHSRIRLLADQFADYGYLVVIPDVFHGQGIPHPYFQRKVLSFQLGHVLNLPCVFLLLDWTPDQGMAAVKPFVSQFPWTRSVNASSQLTCYPAPQTLLV